MPAPYDANRDDITDMLMGQNKGGALGAGLSGLASGTAGMQTQMPAGMLAGMPQTPAGGVPGSGVAPQAPMMQPQPVQRSMGTMPGMPAMGAMTGMGTMNSLNAAPSVSGSPLGVSRQKRMY